jgi:carbamoyl-phosphate synthase small subunit
MAKAPTSPAHASGFGASAPQGATGAIVLADGTILFGRGFGRVGHGVGEVCFNTAMTGYQEVMTDPSYAGQIITFTFPHIGNVGANTEDVEADKPHAVGCIVREDVTAPSSFRSQQRFDDWMAANGLIGISGIDTRALTRRIREAGAPNAVIAHAPDGRFDIDALLAEARRWPGLEGMDLAKVVSRLERAAWDGGVWSLGSGYAAGADGVSTSLDMNDVEKDAPSSPLMSSEVETRAAKHPHVVAIDYGAKHNIFRNLTHAGARVTVVAADSSAEDILSLKPDGIFLSNGPGDPAATGVYAVPVIQQLMDAGLPIFGICLGHQLLALAVGGRTVKMHQGHRGANHPVKRHADGVVEITSMNHGFAVDAASLPEGALVTHTSLFDGSNCGFEMPEKRIFSVQYHPEASPGPQDSFYLFERFVGGLR